MAALRERRDGADAVEGNLEDIIPQLITLTSAQGRCGLDRPDETTAARIRDFVQAIIERAPPIAAQPIQKLIKSINGKWKMLYTNSEMFTFYNGKIHL